MREIADRLATFNSNVAQRMIDDLMYAVQGLYQQLEQIDLHILEHMRVHHMTHTLHGETVSLMDLTRHYVQQDEAPTWLGRLPEAQSDTNNGLFPSIPSTVTDAVIQSIRQARLDAGVSFPSLFEPISDPATWPRDSRIAQCDISTPTLEKTAKTGARRTAKSKSKPMDEIAVWSLTQDVAHLNDAIGELQQYQAQADALDVAIRYPATADEPIFVRQ